MKKKVKNFNFSSSFSPDANSFFFPWGGWAFSRVLDSNSHIYTHTFRIKVWKSFFFSLLLDCCCLITSLTFQTLGVHVWHFQLYTKCCSLYHVDPKNKELVWLKPLYVAILPYALCWCCYISNIHRGDANRSNKSLALCVFIIEF